MLLDKKRHEDQRPTGLIDHRIFKERKKMRKEKDSGLYDLSKKRAKRRSKKGVKSNLRLFDMKEKSM